MRFHPFQSSLIALFFETLTKAIQNGSYLNCQHKQHGFVFLWGRDHIFQVMGPDSHTAYGGHVQPHRVLDALCAVLGKGVQGTVTIPNLYKWVLQNIQKFVKPICPITAASIKVTLFTFQFLYILQVSYKTREVMSVHIFSDINYNLFLHDMLLANNYLYFSSQNMCVDSLGSRYSCS